MTNNEKAIIATCIKSIAEEIVGACEVLVDFYSAEKRAADAAQVEQQEQQQRPKTFGAH